MSAGYNLGITFLMLIIIAFNYCNGISLSLKEENNFVENVSSKLTLADLEVDYNDGLVPDYLKNTLVNATLTSDSASSDYSPRSGILRLRTAVSKLYSKLMNRNLDPENEVLVTVGATEALFSAIMGLSLPDDEWIIIEPFFMPFRKQVELSKAVPRFSTLKLSKTSGRVSAADWELDYAGLKNLINNRTRGIIFNNPNNPTGKCFNRSEVGFIAELAKDHDLFILSDQVHEFTTDSMIRIASMPGMFERTLTMSSVSKALDIPGWRIGWIYGPANLISLVKTVHDNAVGFVSTPQQVAVSAVLEDEITSLGLMNSNTFLTKKITHGRPKREFMVQACREAGMRPIVPDGGNCMLVSWPPLDGSDVELNKYPGADKGEKFANWMKEEIGVAGFTAGKYYSEKHRSLGHEYLRFCYQKSKKTLQNAAKNLLRLRLFEKTQT